MDTWHELAPLAPNEALACRPGTVDLWCSFYEEAWEAELASAQALLMTEDERDRHRRLHFERDRRMFLATRALVRSALSHYADVAPEAWRFAVGERGRPYVTGPACAPSINFNLSNTRGLVVCAVSLAHTEIGVDVEWVDRPGETVALAESYFSPREVRDLLALPASRQRLEFFRYWTLKESYIKARGEGLAIPLDRFSFLLDDRAAIHIDIDTTLRDDARRWRFAQVTAGPSHLIAVCADTAGASLSLRAVENIPLRGCVAPRQREASWPPCPARPSVAATSNDTR